MGIKNAFKKLSLISGSLVLGLSGAASITALATEAAHATSSPGNYYVSNGENASDTNDCTTWKTACATIQGALDASANNESDVTIHVAPKFTETGSINIARSNVTITSFAGPHSQPSVTLTNANDGYGISIGNNDTNNNVTDVTIQNIAFTDPETSGYALHAYHVQSLTLQHDSFTGNDQGAIQNSGGGGVDVNTSWKTTIRNVTAQNFNKNGISFTAAYDGDYDQANPTKDVTLANVTADNNAWAGIVFYTVGNDNSLKNGSVGASDSITGVQFKGKNFIENNSRVGLYIEGASDYQMYQAIYNLSRIPAPNTVTGTYGNTLTIGKLGTTFKDNGEGALAGSPFSSTMTNLDILNAQSANINAKYAKFSVDGSDPLRYKDMDQSQQNNLGKQIMDGNTRLDGQTGNSWDGTGYVQFN